MVIDQTPPSQAVDTLRSALDEVEIGVVLLDQDLVPQFINRCFMRMWHLNNPAELEKLDFEGLMRLIVSKQSQPMPAVKFNEFIKKRTSLIRAGAEDPRDVRLMMARLSASSASRCPMAGACWSMPMLRIWSNKPIS